MRLSDEMPMDPDVLAELEVIDLTLAGEPVDPEYAELAELALMLQMERTEPSPEFARLLDTRANHRFVTQEPTRSRPGRARSGRWDWLQSPAFRTGLVGVCAAAAIAVFAVTHQSGSASNSADIGGATTASATAGTSTSGGAGLEALGASQGAASSSTTSSSSSAASRATTSSSSSSTGSSRAAAGALSKQQATHGSAARPSYGATTTPSSTAATNAVTNAASGSAGAAPSPSTTGRKVVQSAQLTLTASNNRIDRVSQEVFDAVSQAHGIVMSSHINSVAGKQGGTAFFRLSIPTGSLEQTLQSLSTLRYAHVVSRTNNTKDVTKTYRSDRQRLQDAQALRTSLLKQLAQATTQTQIDSLKAQLRDAEAQISSAQYALKHLQHRVSYSSVIVRLYSGNAPVVKPAHHSSGGFTLGGAVHDAGRVLVVAAGVILIGAAGLVPLALLALLVLWVADWLRRRRREQALDQA